MTGLRDAWRARSGGERRVIGAAGAVLAIVVFAAFAWLPMERHRSRLAAENPRLAASLANLERQAAEVKRVRSLPAASPASATPLATLAASGELSRSLSGAQVTLGDARRIRLVAADAAFGALLETIAGAQASHGLRVESARVDALPSPGRVRAEFVLARP